MQHSEKEECDRKIYKTSFFILYLPKYSVILLFYKYIIHFKKVDSKELSYENIGKIDNFKNNFSV